MAGPRRGRGRGRGRRGPLRQGNQEEQPGIAPSNHSRGRRFTLTTVKEAVRASREGTSEEIRQIIQDMETSVMEEQSNSEIEGWAEVISDPGYRRGRLTLYRQTLHIYWVLKRFLAKALEQVAKEMAEIANSVPNLQKEMKNFQVIMTRQNNKLEEMHQQLSRMAHTTPRQAEPVDIPLDMDLNTGIRKE